MLLSAAVLLRRPHNRSTLYAAGFTLVEVIIAIAALGIGVACTVGALTKMNEIASTSRNMTGAYAAVTSQIDLFQSVGPFNPQNNQIPKDAANTYDMTLGTHTLGYKDPATNTVSNLWPIYQSNDANSLIVYGTLTETVTALTAAFATTANESLAAYHQAVFTITYTYRNKQYSFSMSTLRTSDS